MKQKRNLSGCLAAGLLVVFASGQGCPPATMLPTDQEPPQKFSFERDIQPIFNTHCIRCHVTGGFANNSGIPLKLIEGVSYELLFNQPSKQNPALLIVKPYDSANSLLYLKISMDKPPVGRQMPWDKGTVVTQEEIDKIRIWIDEGAKNN